MEYKTKYFNKLIKEGTMCPKCEARHSVGFINKITYALIDTFVVILKSIPIAYGYPSGQMFAMAKQSMLSRYWSYGMMITTADVDLNPQIR